LKELDLTLKFNSLRVPFLKEGLGKRRAWVGRSGIKP
jgi:hypothetical protein